VAEAVLQILTEADVEGLDFRVQECLRTRERHAELVARGVSRTMNPPRISPATPSIWWR
jgi:hypothetical protein